MSTLKVLATCVATLATVSGVAAQEGSAFQVRAGELVLADGSRMEDALLVIEGGKVKRVTRGPMLDEGLPTVVHDGVVTAGLVACRTRSGAGSEAHDPTRSVLPEADVVHAFRPDHSEFEDALAAGITTVVLAPSGTNLVGGTTAVVKTHGGTVLEREGHLALSFSSSSLAGNVPIALRLGSVEEEHALALSQDGGPEDTHVSRRGARSPTSYAGAMRVLRERIEDTEGRFARVASGELPVLFTAHDRNEVARAASFAREHRLTGAIYGAPLAGDPDLVGLLVESGLGVVFSPFRTSRTTRSREAVATLQQAGVPVAFALEGPTREPGAFRMTAVMAVVAGADPGAVLTSLTSTAARLAGVDERVGDLTAGKDADFVLWSGDPLDLSSHVVAVYVDGGLAWSADDAQENGE
jgi:imidazolonepropionase-like amidohydrolase